MRKFVLLILILLLGISSPLMAEVFKLTTTTVAFKHYNEAIKRWSDWSEWEPCSVLVVINADTDRIDIYSKETQQFDIIEDEGSEPDEEGGEIMSWYCVDADGMRCRIRYRIDKDQEMQLYVDYSDFMYVYNVRFK